MIEGNLKYITGQDGIINEVILPVAMFKKMLEELEDKELLRVMKEVENESADYLPEAESFKLIDSLLENSEIQAS